MARRVAARRYSRRRMAFQLNIRSRVRVAASALAALCAAGFLVEVGVVPLGGDIQGVWPSQAHAQSAAAGSVLVVDPVAIQNRSSAAQSIRSQLDARRSEIRSRFDATRQELRAEEAALVELRAQLPATRAEFDRRAADFERRVREFRGSEAAEGAKLNRVVSAANADLQAALRPVLNDLMEERGAEVILDARTVVASASALDVTEEVIARLDEVAPQIELRQEP